MDLKRAEDLTPEDFPAAFRGDDMTPEGEALYHKAEQLEHLFSDMLFLKGSRTYDFVSVTSKDAKTGEVFHLITDLDEEIKDFSLYHFTFDLENFDGDVAGCFHEGDQRLTVSPEYKDDDAILLHELIHLHEFVLDSAPSFYREICLLSLYNDLKEKIDDLDDRILRHCHVEKGNDIAGTGGIHDILFLLKSYDLDLQQGYPLGKVYGYGIREEDEAMDEANRIAEEIRSRDTWDDGLNRKLCALAGIEDEYDRADADTFESVMNKAAEILGVEI